MYQLVTFLCALLVTLFGVIAYVPDEFQSAHWVTDYSRTVASSYSFSFIVALELHKPRQLAQLFMDVSNPKSSMYGKYKTLREISEQFGPTPEDKSRVIQFFQQKIQNCRIRHEEHGDMLEITTDVASVERGLNIQLSWKKHSRNLTLQQSLRSDTPISLPEDIAELVSFISLNAPINHVLPRGSKALKLRQKLIEENENLDLQSRSLFAEDSDYSVSVTSGNQEALVLFKPLCGDGSLNVYSPPCTNLDPSLVPQFSIDATYHANDVSNPYLLTTDPVPFTVSAFNTYCYNSFFKVTCSGNDGLNCTCIAKISPLPKYTQISLNITAVLPDTTDYPVGASKLFALTDVATADFLAKLYNIPPGTAVHHGSNQSVAEFYGEFYSNSDLEKFLELSGLPNASIPTSNVYGDLANNQTKPGGEAQLDVEYIMALAPGADTFFYSFSDLNPNSTINEGFLAYVLYVNGQDYPPLVHSLSYGDVEASIFNSSNAGSIAYGTRVDQEFQKMGLRGLTVLFSSGDDGIGGSYIRDDQELACSQSWPSWPAGSPYVTAVGATQMTDKYLPACGMTYAPSTSYPELPLQDQLVFQCTGTGETVCTSVFGGVITSGGGFSYVYNRSETAPWQEEAVTNYLTGANSNNYPPTYYFNSFGRGYPDVSTYGSNYFVYLSNRITRESGTSASAPVFAAMVTLWNDIRLAYDQPPLGFIAPFLYDIYASHPEAFQDVVTGNNACGVGGGIQTAPCCTYSFSASPGWDAATGLGSPNFQIISNLVINNATYFPDIGAYPAGQTTSDAQPLSEVNNDDSVSKKADNAFSIAIAGLCLAGVVGLATFLYLLFFIPLGGKYGLYQLTQDAGEPLMG